jgi:hypothetical protein
MFAVVRRLRISHLGATIVVQSELLSASSEIAGKVPPPELTNDE